MARCRTCKQAPCAPPVMEPFGVAPSGREVVRFHACGRVFERAWRGLRPTAAAMEVRKPRLGEIQARDPTRRADDADGS